MRTVHTSGKVFRAGLGGFDYFEPQTAAEAVSLLNRYKGDARLLAGGTDLVAGMKKGIYAPQAVINIKKIPALNYQFKFEKNRIVISPLATITDLAESSALQKKIPALPQAALITAPLQLRNRASVGGSLCSRQPTADLIPLFIVLGAKAVIKTKRKQQTVPLEAFFKRDGKTVLENSGILLQLQVPVPGRDEAATLRRHFIRTSMEPAVLSLAVWVKKKRKMIEAVRIAVSGAGPAPQRLSGPELLLKKTAGTDHDIIGAAEQAALDCSCESDIKGTGQYRMDMVKIYLVRALKEVL